MRQPVLIPRLILALSFLLSAPTGQLFAHRDDYINETFVFQTLEAHEFEPELWVDLGSGSHGEGSFRMVNAAFEYGVTEHWMVDGFAGWLHTGDGQDSLQRVRAETRFRFGEEGDRPVDLAASFETEYEREAEHEPAGSASGSTWAWTLTPRLVLSRDLASQFNVTLNLDLGRQFGADARDRWVPGYAIAARYPREAFLRYGAEFRQDFGEERSTLLVPQIWFSLPHEATLKFGAGLDLGGGTRQNFARVVFEIEF